MCQGMAAELRGINLGDKRLNRRTEIVIESLAANPAGSINAACQGWAETEAAYRKVRDEMAESKTQSQRQ